VQFANFGMHLHPQFGAEIGQRLVIKEDFRLADHGAALCDTLRLAPGQPARLMLETIGQGQQVRDGFHTLLPLKLGDSS